MNHIEAILLDWDGTLVDTSQEAFAATKSALLDFGISLQRELYERIYSPNWHRIYEALHLPRHQWEQADSLWLSYYGQKTPLLGNEERRTLSKLAEEFCLGVVTSANRSRVRREIGDLGIEGYFKTVVSGDDVQNRKPHPEGLETAMEQISKQPRVCCYVGDSPDDVEMGKRAGVLTVGIFSNYPGSKELRGAGPDFCIQNLSQLPEALKQETAGVRS